MIVHLLALPLRFLCHTSYLQPIDATVTLETKSYEGKTCVVVEGHALGVGGIVGIAIACAVVLLLVSSVLKCLCCCL